MPEGVDDGVADRGGPLSLPPLTPSGLLGAGVAMKPVVNDGTSPARGIA